MIRSQEQAVECFTQRICNFQLAKHWNHRCVDGGHSGSEVRVRSPIWRMLDGKTVVQRPGLSQRSSDSRIHWRKMNAFTFPGHRLNIALHASRQWHSLLRTSLLSLEALQWPALRWTFTRSRNPWNELQRQWVLSENIRITLVRAENK